MLAVLPASASALHLLATSSKHSLISKDLTERYVPMKLADEGQWLD